MDFFDPSCAPGVCTPTWGGATAREGLGFLRKLKGLNIVGADINTVSPPHDVGGMTAFLAGAVALEILTLFCYAQNLVQEIATSYSVYFTRTGLWVSLSHPTSKRLVIRGR